MSREVTPKSRGYRIRLATPRITRLPSLSRNVARCPRTVVSSFTSSREALAATGPKHDSRGKHRGRAPGPPPCRARGSDDVGAPRDPMLDPRPPHRRHDPLRVRPVRIDLRLRNREAGTFRSASPRPPHDAVRI